MAEHAVPAAESACPNRPGRGHEWYSRGAERFCRDCGYGVWDAEANDAHVAMRAAEIRGGSESPPSQREQLRESVVRERLLLDEVRDLQERLTDTAQLWASALDRITDLEHKVRYLEGLVIDGSDDA
jgi:hypothetical protein